MGSKYFERIQAFYSHHRRMPSNREIVALCGFSSTMQAFRLTTKLAEQGLLAKDRTGRLIPTVRFLGGLKILGVVEAGWPSPAEEELADIMRLEEWLVEKKEATYLLKVKGDSMKDAGILPGDLVVVERTDTPKTGQIVVAEIDGEWTLKRLRRTRNGKPYLEAANERYAPLYPERELKIAAVVRGVVRKY
jgi:SOS regulatory protein LexA